MLEEDANMKKVEQYCKRIIDTEDLIHLVRERRCLWDRSHANYRVRTEKERAWCEVYKEIEPDYEKCSEGLKNLIGLQITRKWYNIRDSYVKSKKSLSLRHKPYLHAKLLSFLEPIYFEENQDRKSEEKSENEESQEHWLNEVFVEEDEEARSSDAKRPKIDDKPKEAVGAEESFVNILSNIISKEEDDDRAFFKSIMPAVKKLSEDAKFDFRIQIMNVLRSLLNKDRATIEMKQEDTISNLTM